MIQSGDPTDTGKGGQSIWGKPFKNELNSKLIHSGRGVVSTTNSGSNTNGSQFFILYKSANHLNFKHTVFGIIVGGMTTLTTMEKVPVDVDDGDRPLEDIKLLNITIFVKDVNPYAEPDEEEQKEEEKKIVDVDHDKVGSWYNNQGTGATGTVSAGEVDKYIKTRTSGADPTAGSGVGANLSTKKWKVEDLSCAQYTNFSGW